MDLYAFTNVHTHAHSVCVRVYIYVPMYTCIYVGMYSFVHINIHWSSMVLKWCHFQLIVAAIQTFGHVCPQFCIISLLSISRSQLYFYRNWYLLIFIFGTFISPFKILRTCSTIPYVYFTRTCKRVFNLYAGVSFFSCIYVFHDIVLPYLF